MVLKLVQLIWEEKNVKHIAKHYVSIDEVEEIFTKFHHVGKAKNKRKIVTGETDDGRILEVPLVHKGRGRYFPLTAYDAGEYRTRVYLHAKAHHARGR